MQVAREFFIDNLLVHLYLITQTIMRTGIALNPVGNPGANLKSISHRCHPILVAFVWEITKETIKLPLGCLQGEREFESPFHGSRVSTFHWRRHQPDLHLRLRV